MQTTTTQVAACRVDLTPEPPVCLGGNRGPGHVGRVIGDPLEANALALRDGDERWLFVVSIDTLYAPAELQRRLEQRLRERLGEDGDFLLLLAASHTHYAPMLDPSKPVLGRAEEGYLETLAARIEEALLALVDGGVEPARATLARGRFRGIANRRRLGRNLRRPWRRTMMILPNDEARLWDELPLVRVEDEDGEAIALLWSLACHPVSYPRAGTVSASYPGIVRERLRRTLDRPELPVLFLLGPAGDQRPPAWETPPHSWKAAAIAALNFRHGGRSVFTNFTDAGYRAWVESLCAAATRTLGKTGDRLELRASWRQTALPLTELMEGHGQGLELALSRADLAEGLSLLTLSAEPCAELAFRLRELSGNVGLWVAGCIGPIFGYLPSERMLAEGGYEVDGFQGFFDIEGHYRRGFQGAIEEKVRSLFDQA